MKRLSILMKCLFLMMMAANISAMAQEVTVELNPGWTWIGSPFMEPVELETALSSITPQEGDIIKSQTGLSTYYWGFWMGDVTSLLPGRGYKYFSNNSETVILTFGNAASGVVSLDTPTDITAISAVVNSTVTLETGNHIFARGVCWGTEPSPTIDGLHTSDETIAGNISVTLEDLTPNTTYYVRAYVVSDQGLAYCEEQTFTTLDGIPTLTTAAVTYISGRYANSGGTVTEDDGVEITSRGVCWSTNPNPTLSDNHSTDGKGMGNFSSTLTGLEATTTYYVRAYATTIIGVGYGEEMSFTTLENNSNAPSGAIDGLFSVSASTQVYFSQGNLQYIGSVSTPYWKFADNQWDYFGTTTGQNSSDENIDRDLFGWGTSGYNHGATCYQPWSTSEKNIDYQAYGHYTNDLNAQTGQADWGYNAISNCGDEENQWHTLSRAEWVYVFNTRSTASGIRYAKAKVNNVNGMVLLPDDWDTSTYGLNSTNTSNVSYSSNEITASDWSVMEQAGAVFLPATGGRYGVAVRRVGSDGYYWSTTYINSDRTCAVNFNDSTFGPEYANNRYDGFSVRLVRAAE